MKTKIQLTFLLIWMFSSSSYALDHVNKTISILQSPDNRPCTFFRLADVQVADPEVMDNPWFAVPQTHIAYREIVSFLLTAYSSGMNVTVATSGVGKAECSGIATISYVRLDVE